MPLSGEKDHISEPFAVSMALNFPVTTPMYSVFPSITGLAMETLPMVLDHIFFPESAEIRP